MKGELLWQGGKLIYDLCSFLNTVDMFSDVLLLNAEAVPKKILENMNVPGLTRENVASHLQVSLLFS